MNLHPVPDEGEPPSTCEPAPTPLPNGLPCREPERVPVQMPVDVRSLSLAVLAVLATVFILRWASEVFIPLMMGILCSYALSPLVDRLERLRLPRAVGAGLLVGSLVAVTGWTAYALSDDAALLIESLPAAAQKVREAVRARHGAPANAIDTLQKAAAQLEQAAQEGGPASPSTARGVTRVRIERPQFDIKDYLWSGTLGLATSISQAVVVLFIAFFLLASGSRFRLKFVRMAGPTFARRKITVQALDEITDQIQRYLLVQVLTSAVVGVATWLVFAMIGVEHAAVWGVIAFALNFVPYIGSIAVTVGSALVAFLQFGRVDMALLVGGSYALLDSLSGYVLTPWLTSRTSRLNALAVFVGVLSFGWLWGLWGLLLGVPILTMIKAVCDRVDDLKPVGELLGT